MVIQKYDSENKIRPGVYIKTVIVPNNNASATGKGAVAIATQMEWGPENVLIECNQADYFAGKYKHLIGYGLGETTKVLPFTLPMSNCYKGYFYRLNTGGVKASALLGSDEDEISITAKYSGVVGNTIKVVIIQDKPSMGKFVLEVYVNETKEEKIILNDNEDIRNVKSEWVDISVGEEFTTITPTAGATLTGGTNGSVDNTALDNFFGTLTYKHINMVAVNDATDATQNKLAEWGMEQRDSKAKGVRVVCISQPKDSEAVISTYNQGYKTKDYHITPELFTLLVAGAEAGCPCNQSLASRVINDAIEIINPVEEDDVEDLLEAGFFLLTYDIDGAVCIEEDNNSLITFSDSKPKDFRLNQVINVLDFINYETAYIFAKNYAGKFTNTENTRTQFKSDIITGVFDYLYKLGAIEEYDSDSDITIVKKDATSATLGEYFTVAQTWTKLFVVNNIKF